MAKYDAETEDAAEASEADRCLPSSCGGVLCVWLMYRGGAFPRARLDVPDSPEVPHCAVCLESSRHLGPLFPLCCCSAERRQPAAHQAQLYHRSAKRGGRRTCYKQRQAASFCCVLLYSLSCFLLVAGPCPVLEARGGSSSALRSCVSSASALGSGDGGAARGLEVRGPVLKPPVSGLGAGFAVEDRAQWRRGFDGPA